MYTYFLLMNDYGFKVVTLLFLNEQEGYYPREDDVYDPNLPNFGNSNYGNNDKYGVVTWGLNYQNGMDARLFFVTENRNSWSQCRWDPYDDSIPQFWRISKHTNKQICYTPEALLYAQSAYFTVVIITQIANQLICRTRVLSLGIHGVSNHYANFSFLIEIGFACLLLYVYEICDALNTREIASPHFIVPGMHYFAAMFFFDEVRKIYIRKGIKKDPETKRSSYKGWLARNVLY
jgi:sodium/potassium-transporting ATPase subunit alpha